MPKAAFPKYLALLFSMLLAAALVPLAANPAAASEIPPGFSVVDQYTEAFPGVGGDKKPPSGNQKNIDSFPRETVDRFTEAGPSGVAALNLAAAGAPERALPNTSVNERGRNGQIRSGAAAGDQSDRGLALAAPPVDGGQQVAKQVFGVAGSDGMGIFLPLILVMALLLGGLYVVRSKRTVL